MAGTSTGKQPSAKSPARNPLALDSLIGFEKRNSRVLVKLNANANKTYMAGSRKRGANKAKAKRKLCLGDLVLAKVKGFPAWPAKISRPEDWGKAPDPKNCFVQFFGTQEIAFVAPANIQAFTSEAKNRLSARCQRKTMKYFAQAVKEICVAFEELQKEKSSGWRDDTDGSALGCEADDEVDVDLKDEMGTVGPNGKTLHEEIGDLGSKLEPCSRRRGETDGEDIKPSLSSHVDSFSPVMSSEEKVKIFNGAQPKKEVLSPSPSDIHIYSLQSDIERSKNGPS